MKVIDEPVLRGREYVFEDRVDAGERLARKLVEVLGLNVEGNVLAIPAGGVPVGWVVARNLRLPLDVFVVRKVQVPWNTEAGFGAVGWDGTVILNQKILESLHLTQKEIEACIIKAKRNVEERIKKFRGCKPFPNLKGKTAILVDDGLATGFTMATSVEILAKHQPQKIIVATPTGSIDAVEFLASNQKIDLIVCLNIRSGFIFAVADAYKNWYDLTDEEVLKYLRNSIKQT